MKRFKKEKSPPPPVPKSPTLDRQKSRDKVMELLGGNVLGVLPPRDPNARPFTVGCTIDQVQRMYPHDEGMWLLWCKENEEKTQVTVRQSSGNVTGSSEHDESTAAGAGGWSNETQNLNANEGNSTDERGANAAEASSLDTATTKHQKSNTKAENPVSKMVQPAETIASGSKERYRSPYRTLKSTVVADASAHKSGSPDSRSSSYYSAKQSVSQKSIDSGQEEQTSRPSQDSKRTKKSIAGTVSTVSTDKFALDTESLYNLENEGSVPIDRSDESIEAEASEESIESQRDFPQSSSTQKIGVRPPDERNMPRPSVIGVGGETSSDLFELADRTRKKHKAESAPNPNRKHNFKTLELEDLQSMRMTLSRAYLDRQLRKDLYCDTGLRKGIVQSAAKEKLVNNDFNDALLKIEADICATPLYEKYDKWAHANGRQSLKALAEDDARDTDEVMKEIQFREYDSWLRNL